MADLCMTGLKKIGVCTKANSYKMWKLSNAAATRGNVSNTMCVLFKTYNEAQNCYNMMQSKLAKFLCSKLVVDVTSTTSTHRGMSDYTHPWTDEMLYEYFNLTPEEIATIESEVNEV